jgi:hypothetical protein
MTTDTIDNPTEEKVNVGSNSKKFDFNNCTAEELFEHVELWRQGKDRKNGDEFLLLDEKDPVAYDRINNMLIAGKSDPPKEDTKEVVEDEKISESKPEVKEDDDFIEIQSIKLRKDQLGTFLKNRSPEEALLLKLDAHDHAERTIKDLKERNNGLSSQTLKLREKLIESKKQPPPKAEVKEEDSPDEFDFNREDADLYDPDQQEKFLSNYEKMLKKLKQGIPVDLKQEEVKKEQPSVEQELLNHLKDRSLQEEFDEINDLQRAVPELRFSDGSTFEQKDQQLLAFRQKVAAVVGVTDTVKAHQQYLSNPQVRQLCEARGILEPPELDKWNAIVQVRIKRNDNMNNYAQRIGKESVEIPNFMGNTYIDNYNKMNLNVGFDKEKLNTQIKQHEEAERKRDDSQSRYVTEPPPEASHTSNAELGQYSETEILNIANRYAAKGIDSISQDEARLLVRLNEIQDNPQPLDLLQKAKE